jgi:acyl carrier protein
MLNTNSKNEIVFRTIVEMLTPKLSRPEFKGGVNASTELSELGLIDSTHLLDIIFEVEKRCAVEFDPTRVDFQEALTLGSLVSAFITA